MSYRDSRIVLIVHDSRTVRAGMGVHQELLRRPTIELAARVALPAHLANATSAKAEDYLVGRDLDERIEAGEEGLNIIWPLRRGKVRDWHAMTALWRHVLFKLLGIRRSRNDSPILLSLPAPLSRAEHALVAQVFFEHLNAPSLCIMEQPLLAAYGVGTLSATVIDVGWEQCAVSPVLDCLVQHASLARCGVGMRHCALYLAHLLRKDAGIKDALVRVMSVTPGKSNADQGGARADAEQGLQRLLLQLASQLIDDGHCAVEAEGQAGDEQRGDAAAAAADDEFDVAAALVAGRERAAIEEQERKNRAAMKASQAAAAEAAAAGEAGSGETGAAAGSSQESAAKNGAQSDAAGPHASSDSRRSRDGLASGEGAEQGEEEEEDDEEEGVAVVNFRGVKVKVARAILAQVADPLFDPSLLAGVKGVEESGASASWGDDLGAEPLGDGVDEGSKVSGGHDDAAGDADWPALVALPASQRPSLPETVASSLSRVAEAEKRPLLWESFVVTGAPVHSVRGLTASVVAACQRHVATSAATASGAGATSGPSERSGLTTGDSTPGGPNDFGDGSGAAAAGPTAPNATYQPTAVRSLRVPDYFAEYKGETTSRTDLAAFLGATIYAKLAFDAQGRNHVTKAAYNERGPSAMFSVTVV